MAREVVARVEGLTKDEAEAVCETIRKVQAADKALQEPKA